MYLLSERKVTVRIKHQCCGCISNIPPGDEAVSTTIDDGGTLYTVYRCQVCSDFLDTLTGLDRPTEWDEGQLREMPGHPLYGVPLK